MRNEGKGEELGGKIRAGVGKLIGNEQMQAEGKAHELKGKAKQAVAKAAERAETKVRDTAIAAHRGPDDADAEKEAEERLEAERRAEEQQSGLPRAT